MKKNLSLTASVNLNSREGRIFSDCAYDMCLVNNEVLPPIARYILVQNVST